MRYVHVKEISEISMENGRRHGTYSVPVSWEGFHPALWQNDMGIMVSLINQQR